MLFQSPYPNHSYVEFIVGAGGITTGTTVFNFAKNFLRLDHIKVYHKLISDLTTWNLISTSHYTNSGSSGAGVVTLGGSFPVRTDGDFIRIVRETPVTAAGRLVDFAPGSLAEADLDTSALQDLYCAQEALDRVYAMTFVLSPAILTSIFPAGYTWQSV